jgi:hypothetical protein
MTRFLDILTLTFALIAMAVLPILYGWAGVVVGLGCGVIAFASLMARAEGRESDW